MADPQTSRDIPTFGPYRLVARLGEGSTGSVYRVTRGDDPTPLALKILSLEASNDERWRLRFERESLILRRLKHPNIVACLDCGNLEGRAYLAMELVEGRSARSLVNEQLNAASLAKLGAQLANGLAAAHAQGLIHRDLKPENIVVTRAGVAKILDLGLARHVAASVHIMPAHLVEVTGPGVVVGTARYMSPEQSRGDVLTPATDIFCLGLCLFELAAGRHAFASPFAQEVVTGIREKPAPSVERWRQDLPKPAVELIMSMLAKDPAVRPAATQIAQQFRQMLH